MEIYSWLPNRRGDLISEWLWDFRENPLKKHRKGLQTAQKSQKFALRCRAAPARAFLGASRVNQKSADQVVEQTTRARARVLLPLLKSKKVFPRRGELDARASSAQTRWSLARAQI